MPLSSPLVDPGVGAAPSPHGGGQRPQHHPVTQDEDMPGEKRDFSHLNQTQTFHSEVESRLEGETNAHN